MNNIYEAELNLEWWNSKSPAYQKRYLQKHPHSIYADKVKSGELEVADNSTNSTSKEQSKIEKKRSTTQEKLEKNTQLRDEKRAQYDKLKAEYNAIPMPVWNHDTDNWASEDDAKWNEERSVIRGRMRSVWAEYETAKHNVELAERYLKRLHQQENFLKRNAGPNTTTKYEKAGIAKYVDFSGMDEESETAAINAVSENIKRHPFMKGHLTFLGSHKSSKFKHLSQQLAYEYYYNDLQKRYNEAKDYIAKKEGSAYTGTQKDPQSIYDDKAHWLDESKREEFKYYMYNIKEKYRIIEAVDNRGGIAEYLQTSTYQKAINRWQRMSSRTWAFYRSDTLKNGQQGMISFNENNFDSAELKRNVENKWHPVGCDTKKAVLDHEFSHAIWYRLGLNKEGEPNLNGNDYRGRSPLQQFIAHEMWSGKEYLKNHLSRYAATNASEFFAEAYSEYLNNPNPRPIAKEVARLLKKELKLRGIEE